MKTILETRRLISRELLPLDAVNILKLHQDKKVMQYTGFPLCKDIAEAEQYIEKQIEHYREYGLGQWAVHLRANGLFTGWCGFTVIEESEELELSYRFHKRFWNKGFASEIVESCLEYGKSSSNYKTIIARVVPENKASIRMLEKVGMQVVGATKCNGREALKYKVER